MTRIDTNGTVLLGLEAGIGRLTLNRPEAGNALDAGTIHAVAAAMHAICDEPSVRVVLIAGRGKAFCAGGDINTFGHANERLADLLDSVLTPLHEAIHRLSASGLPIITAVNGPVGGGGIGLALCGDFVLAAESMKLRCGYSAIGLTPDAGSSWFLAKRAGAVKAKHLFFLNEALSARECQASGIVDEVCDDDALAGRAEELALKLCAAPRKVIARTKALVDGLDGRTLEAHLLLERRYMVASGAEPDAREGIAAFLSKRRPDFE